jgi:MoaA/NifB/PqqE/SkfB family radical SAM enzyme
MDIGIFRKVADTLFPFLITVELNSRGEPMIHPQFTEMQEMMLDYDIFTRYQTNGTQFVARKLALLAKTRGDVSISIDATGDLFEYARTGGKWEQVDAGTRNLMKMRNPERLGVGLYPTLTAKTIEGAPALIDWAVAIGVDRIDFHVYEPIAAGMTRLR